MLVPDCSKGHRFRLFKKGQAQGVIFSALGVAQEFSGFEKGGQKGLERAASADNPRRDAVDAGIEEVEPDMRAPEKTAAHKLFHDRSGSVVEKDNMVAVPTNATAHVQEQLGDELEDRGHFVCQVLRRMKMPGVEAVEELVLYGIREVKLVGADDIAFRADSEELALDRIEVKRAIDRGRKNLVERGG